MVSVENYEKVAELATNAVYLYYTGDQWKIGKVYYSYIVLNYYLLTQSIEPFIEYTYLFLIY